jgi:hypothetical protein
MTELETLLAEIEQRANDAKQMPRYRGDNPAMDLYAQDVPRLVVALRRAIEQRNDWAESVTWEWTKHAAKENVELAAILMPDQE